MSPPDVRPSKSSQQLFESSDDDDLPAEPALPALPPIPQSHFSPSPPVSPTAPPESAIVPVALASAPESKLLLPLAQLFVDDDASSVCMKCSSEVPLVRMVASSVRDWLHLPPALLLCVLVVVYLASSCARLVVSSAVL